MGIVGRIGKVHKTGLLRIQDEDAHKIVGVLPGFLEPGELLQTQNLAVNKFFHGGCPDTPLGIELTVIEHRAAQFRIARFKGYENRILRSPAVQNFVGNTLKVRGIIAEVSFQVWPRPLRG